MDSARYWKQISAYRNYFPDSQIHVMFFDDWKNNPQCAVKQCCEFLGVDSHFKLPVSQKGQTLGQLRDRQLLWNLRNIKGYRVIRDLIPNGIRSSARPFLKTPIRYLPELSGETLRMLTNELSGDLAQFLEFYNRPGLWSLVTDHEPSVAA